MSKEESDSMRKEGGRRGKKLEEKRSSKRNDHFLTPMRALCKEERSVMRREGARRGTTLEEERNSEINGLF